MKISTITFHRSVNYGAVLQAYALQQALKKCGYDSEVIDYARMNSSLFTKINFRQPMKAIKQLILNFLTVCHYSERKRLFENFNSFMNSYIKLTKRYESYDELCKKPPKSDMYLMGSDQVWNITYRYRPEFFAEFAPKGVKRASYAASIGNYKYNEEQLKRMAQGLNGISPVSVREESAAVFLRENFNMEADVHPDPVFLLTSEDWNEISIQPQISEKYILSYALTRNDLMQQAINKLKKETGYKVVVVSSQANKFVKGDIYIYDAGPREFVGLFQCAECVLTTSFHGTAFSILLNKPFYNFTIDYYSSRTTNLLNKFELTNRIPKSVDEITIHEMDYSKVNAIKQQYVETAYAYLRSLSAECGGIEDDRC